jgi:hypothetical protein
LSISFFNILDVGEPVSTSDIAVFTGTLKLQNEFFHWRPLVPVFFPEMLLANFRRLFLPALGFLIPYCAPNRNWNTSRRRFRIEATGKGIPGTAARTMFLTRILTAAQTDLDDLIEPARNFSYAVAGIRSLPNKSRKRATLVSAGLMRPKCLREILDKIEHRHIASQNFERDRAAVAGFA